VLVGVDQAGDDETSFKVNDIDSRTNFDCRCQALDLAALPDQ